MEEINRLERLSSYEQRSIDGHHMDITAFHEVTALVMKVVRKYIPEGKSEKDLSPEDREAFRAEMAQLRKDCGMPA